ncbi:hypothetical protein IU450_38920 [Nocardia abscessus]|uniref:hypothetical protein n=1 Tax=Nocardia abscessus TaxID=120957 RepID=UPI0018933616|nr:hypothetical protein [Nocardia abscessus]MBF6341811.1 hypothetical protein [Nocardia abscessus]
MPIPWRAATESFEQFLGKHGVGPAAVTDVEAAWRAFVEFSQTEIDGIAPANEDGDGFIIQWGRYSWDNNRLSLTLTRQLATVDASEQIEADDPDWQHLWQVELTMVFDDEPELVAHESGLDAPDTGFRFEPIGPLRAAALAEVRVQAQRQALVEAMWTATPVHSELTFECVC